MLGLVLGDILGLFGYSDFLFSEYWLIMSETQFNWIVIAKMCHLCLLICLISIVYGNYNREYKICFCIFYNSSFSAGRGFTAPFLRLRGFCAGKGRAFARSDAMLRTLKRRVQEPGLTAMSRVRSFMGTLRFSKLKIRFQKFMPILKSVFKIHLKLLAMHSIIRMIFIRLDEIF